MSEKKPPTKHIVLTSHPNQVGPKPIDIKWGASDPKERGPVIATTTQLERRNTIGTHSGSYSVYRALAIAAGALKADHIADLTNTAPAVSIGPFSSWGDNEKIVSLDPFGHMSTVVFSELIAQGYDIRPSIAITKARIFFPEIKEAVEAGRLKVDGQVLLSDGSANVIKVAVEPVWYLPGIAKRFKTNESELRRMLFEQTAGMFPELITRRDLHVFLPPIGGQTVYLFGDVESIPDRNKPLSVRVHDECNGSDVFGSDICTCRPYLAHGVELCVESAQNDGAGIIVYSRKEGRALGEVTKFLVYNARKRQSGGDTADKYFERTECVAGVQDMRFQELMPDCLHWLGVKFIDRFASMSDMKYDALTKSGIEVGERVSIPPDLIPEDASVEMEAKKAAGYYNDSGSLNQGELSKVKGRGLDE